MDKGFIVYIISQKRLENKWISIKGVGIIRAEIGLKNRQIINEAHSFHCVLIL
jgi:hypothetical protein